MFFEEYFVRLFCCLLTLLFFFTCSEEKLKKSLGTRVATPSAVVVTADQNYFIALSGNLNNRFSGGNLLVIPADGEGEVSSQSIPRLGRSMQLAGDLLLVTYDSPAGSTTGRVDLFELGKESPPSLTLKRTWETPGCRGLNSAISTRTDFFAVTCDMVGKNDPGVSADDQSSLGSSLWFGTLDRGDLSQSKLHLARTYENYVRRALHLHVDGEKTYLFAFVTDWGKPNLFDGLYKDSTGNGVPDDLESEVRARRSLEKGHYYQFIVSELSAAEQRNSAGEFVKLTKKDESYWLHFLSSEERNYYRTNFWEAKPDPTDSKAFFLSHRGKGEDLRSPDANNIVRVKVTAAPAPGVLSKDFLEFERVLGPGKDGYVGDFFVSNDLVVSNNLRGGLEFDKEMSSIEVFARGDDGRAGESIAKLVGSSSMDSFYQFGVSKGSSGETSVLVSSFLGDYLSLYKLDVAGKSLNLVKEFR